MWLATFHGINLEQSEQTFPGGYDMKYRLQAFLIHLSLSALVLSVTFALVALVWYPAPLFWADGGREVIMLIAFVDVILGPSLTFAVYSKGKKSLKFDLSVIAACQLAALAYGATVMYQQRPVFVAFALDGFYTVTAGQVEAQSPKTLKDLTALMPQASNWVYVEIPQGRDAFHRLFNKQDTPVLSLRTDLYQPLDGNNLRNALRRAVDMRALLKDETRKTKESDLQTLNRFLAEKHVAENDVAFLPFIARYRQMFAAYRKSDLKPLGFLEIQPDLLGGKPE